MISEKAPVRLAVSHNGGRDWLIAGTALPERPVATGGLEQVAATSVRDVWALSRTGQVLATSNGGARWTVQPLARPVVQLAQAGRSVWALACPHTVGLRCRPVLEQIRSPGARWTRLSIPRLASDPNPQLAVVSGRRLVLR